MADSSGNLTADYLVNVSNQISGSTGFVDNIPMYIGDPPYDPISWWYPYKPYKWEWHHDYCYPKTVYKYQLICPRCKRANWAELDTVIVCACGARLKAVTDKVDYEIPVTK